MIVKIIDFCYFTELNEESVKLFIRNSLEDFISENGELDIEHWMEILEESEKFELIAQEKDPLIEYNEEKIDEIVEEIENEKEDEDIEIEDEDDSAEEGVSEDEEEDN